MVASIRWGRYRFQSFCFLLTNLENMASRVLWHPSTMPLPPQRQGPCVINFKDPAHVLTKSMFKFYPRSVWSCLGATKPWRWTHECFIFLVQYGRLPCPFREAVWDDKDVLVICGNPLHRGVEVVGLHSCSWVFLGSSSRHRNHSDHTQVQHVFIGQTSEKVHWIAQLCSFPWCWGVPL